MDNNKKLDTDYIWYADLKKSKEQLAKVSPSFCLAKWLQVTLHLHKGMTHSCHHPTPHKITLDDIESNPSGLHNTAQKLNERAEMLKGNQPKPCEYCWNVENANANAISDRVMKSSSEWAFPHANAVVESGLGAKINPRYLEISFSSLCNFKCSYCSADYSTKWQQEIEQYGSYTNETGAMTSPTINEDVNPYIDTFWQWWPDLKKDLHVFRITGGEPLLSKNTWKILEDIDQNPAPHLQLAINSNLGVPTELVEKLTQKLKKLLDENKVRDVRLFTSIDTIGADAEIIRYGLHSDTFFKHLELVLKAVPTMRVVIMATYNALSVFKYTELLKKILEIRKKYVSPKRIQPLGISTSYLRYPEILSVKILDEKFVEYPQDSLNFMEEHQFNEKTYPAGFTEYEVSSMRNLIEWFQTPIEAQKKRFLQKEFEKFYEEHDRRRGTQSKWLVDRLKTW